MRQASIMVLALFAAILFLMASPMNARSQNPIQNMEMPVQTKQHRQLATLTGDWSIRGRTYKGCPYGEGTFTAREHNEFMKGGLFLVSRTQYSSLFKNSNQIALFGVDPITKQYTYSMHSNLGITITSAGEVRNKAKTELVGNAITWTDTKVNIHLHGAPEMTYTTEFVSPNEYRFILTAGSMLWYRGVAKRLRISRPQAKRDGRLK